MPFSESRYNHKPNAELHTVGKETRDKEMDW